MVKSKDTYSSGANNPTAQDDVTEQWQTLIEEQGVEPRQFNREGGLLTSANMATAAGPTADAYIPGSRQSDRIIDARTSGMENWMDSMHQGFRGINRDTYYPPDSAGIVRFPQMGLIPLDGLQRSSTPVQAGGGYTAFLNDQGAIQAEGTLGPRFQPLGRSPGPAPVGQGDVPGIIANAVLEPYHAFLRAWEAISTGGEASVSDVLQVAVPASIPGARLPTQRARAPEQPSIVGGSPYAEHSSSDLRIENYPAFREYNFARNVDEYPDMPLPGNFMDNQMAAIDNAGLSADEIAYNNAVRQQQQGQQARRFDNDPTGPPAWRLFEDNETIRDARVIAMQGRGQRNLQAANENESFFRGTELERNLARGDLEASVSAIEAGRTIPQLPDNLVDVQVMLNRLELPEGSVSMRVSRPHPETGAISYYLRIKNPLEGQPDIRVRIGDHSQTRASDNQPAGSRRNEIDASTPEGLKTLLDKLSTQETIPQQPQARAQVTPDAIARDPQFRRNIPDNVPIPNRLGTRDDPLAVPRIHEVITAGARAGMNNFEIRQALRAHGEEVTEGQIHTYIKRILKELKDG